MKAYAVSALYGRDIKDCANSLVGTDDYKLKGYRTVEETEKRIRAEMKRIEHTHKQAYY